MGTSLSANLSTTNTKLGFHFSEGRTMKISRQLLFIILIVKSASLFAQEEDILRPHGKPKKDEISNDNTSVSQGWWEIGLEFGASNNQLRGNSFTRDVVIPVSPTEVLGKEAKGLSGYFGAEVGYHFNQRFSFHLMAEYDVKKWGDTLIGGADYNMGVFFENGSVKADYTASYADLTITPSLRITTDKLSGRAANADGKAMFDMEQLFFLVGVIYATRIEYVTRKDVLSVSDGIANHFVLQDYEGNPITEKSISRTVTSSNVLDVTPGPATSTQYSSSRLGLQVGMGFDFSLAKNLLLNFHVRFNYYLTPIYSKLTLTDVWRAGTIGASNITFNDTNLHALQAGFGLWFNLK